MLSHQILTRTAIDRLRSVEVAAIKTLLGERFRPGDPWADVWRVTERDNGGTLSGTGQELVRVELIEHASGGYEWDTDALRAAGLEVLEDRSDFPRGNLRYGGPSIRNIIARPAGPMRTRLALVERQPWEEARVEAQLALTLAFDVSEKGGLSRADRQRLGVVPP